MCIVKFKNKLNIFVHCVCTRTDVYSVHRYILVQVYTIIDLYPDE